MNKIRYISPYFQMVRDNSTFFKAYYFHSIIDLNLTKLDSILKHGIMCKRDIERNHLITLYTHDARSFDSKNGSSCVSLTSYSDENSFNTLFESFPTHTLTSLSLMVSKDIKTSKVGESETFFDDEIFYHGSISKEYLQGIIYPEHLTNLLIKDVNPLPNDLECYTKKYLLNWLKCMERYFGLTIAPDKLLDFIDTFWDIALEYECPERWVEGIIRTQKEKYGEDLKDVLASILHTCWTLKLQKDNPTFQDVVINLNNNSLPIYEIKQKVLRRVS